MFNGSFEVVEPLECELASCKPKIVELRASALATLWSSLAV